MLCGLALGLAAPRALASEARYRLAIPPRPYADALIELGVQANVSVIGTSACGGVGQAGVTGALTLDEALRRLLAGAPCSYRILDPRTVRISEPVHTRAVEPVRAATLVAELLVTATKRPASTSRLPASVTVIPRDQIELTGTADVLQATGQLSGVLTTNLGPGRDKLILRGLSDGAFTGRARSAVGSYLDDAPVNYNAPDPDLQLVDIERIEVVRGPQGALYGSGSLSGVYRIVTRKPDLTAPAFGVAGLTAVTYGGSPTNEIEGYANLPLWTDVAAVRMVGYREVQGGFIDNATLRLSNVDRTVRDGGRAALRVQPTDAWQLDLSLSAQRLRSADTSYTTPSDSAAIRLSTTERLSRVREGHKNDFAEASATLRGELGWAVMRSTVAFISHVFSSQYDASTVLNQLGADPSDLGVYSEGARINMVSTDTILRSSRPGPFTWLAGIESIATIEKTPTALDTQAPAGPLHRIYSESRRDRVREVAAYGEASYDFRSGWTASLGGRLFSSDVKTSALILATFPGGVSRDFQGARSFRGFSPKLSLQYEFRSGALLYGLYSEGYRPGGFNSGGFLQIKPSRIAFSPDRLTNYEVGLKLNLLDRRLTLRSAVFLDRWKNIQTDQYRPSGLPYTANVGDSDVVGLESEIGWDVGAGLSLQANALLANSRVTHTNPDFANGDPVVASLPGVPKFSAGLLVMYAHPLPRNLTFRLMGETSYVGRSALSFDAALSSPQGEYARTKLSAQVAGRGWNATLFVTNPANAAGDTFAYGNPFTFGQVRQSTPQRPRTIGLRLAANY
ncbi:TonB-dependent receptor [Phenylobacterium sp.]|uniref:TonB-dependent receptor n=1 Tax=Phenylobacterium sp. TaxID=1871053 RepID=UPI002DF643FC|nr:TonB-dependent receptor [Phenylobacterium sp.]